LSAIAAPLGAQAADSVYDGGAFAITLPRGYPPMEVGSQMRNGQEFATYSSTKGDKSMVLVLRADIPQTITDTSLATRRAFLQLARAGIGQQNTMRMTGEPRELLQDDRVALRIPMAMESEGEKVAGATEVSVPRRGPVTMWMVMVFSRETGASSAIPAAVERVLDSFRLTGEPAVAVDRGPDDVFEWIAGRWQWAGRDPACDSAFTLAVAPGRESVRLEYARAPGASDTTRIFVYRVQESGPDHIRGRIERETRKDDAGKPVVWDFVRQSRDAFCWHRVDWAEGACTPPLHRCPAPRAGAGTAAGTTLDARTAAR
ncbi:MAG TPA: hypothetical protein VF771_02325, partial [Longimicrobiaceae bacterium]